MTTKQAVSVHAAHRMANVHYAIRDLVVLADQVEKEGHRVLYLNIGDPPKYDFKTPPHMIEAVRKAMVDGYNGYADSLGIPVAVNAIRNDAEARGIRNIQSIFVCYGSGEAIDACLTALVNPGENVLTPCPVYPLYSAVLSKLEATPNSYNLDEENGWQPDLADMESKINERTRAIMIANPNNPTGAVYSRKTLEAIAELARKYGLLLLADEIYQNLILDESERHYPLASLAPDVPCITFSSLSKAYLAPGWRTGWGIASGPKEALQSYLDGIHQLLRARLSAPYPFQFGVQAAFEGPQDHVVEVRAKLKKRRDITVEWAKNTPHVSLTAPKGAFYAFPRFEIPEDDESFVKELLRKKYVLLVNGSGFGEQPGTRHARIVFLPEDKELRDAYQRMTDFMRERYS